MATVLEDEDLIAQAQERERARLEEEAAILAFQQQQAALPPPVWAGSPVAVIDEFNAQPGVVGAPITIGSEQYMNEVARAQRGSGFVNADVSPTGEVLTPGYDPLKDFAALKAQQEATNLQRNQYVNSLVQGGATYAEAFRAGQGRYPQAGNESMRLRVEQLAQKTQPRALMQPEVVTVDGVKVMRTGPNSFARVPEPRTSLAARAVAPPDTVASQKVITGQIAETRKELARAKKELEEQPRNVDAARRGNIYQQRLTELEKALIAGSTNWLGGASSPVIPATITPFKEGTIVKNKQSGKLYRVQNGEPTEIRQ